MNRTFKDINLGSTKGKKLHCFFQTRDTGAKSELENLRIGFSLEITVLERRQQQLGRMASLLPPVTFSVFDL